MDVGIGVILLVNADTFGSPDMYGVILSLMYALSSRLRGLPGFIPLMSAGIELIMAVALNLNEDVVARNFQLGGFSFPFC